MHTYCLQNEHELHQKDLNHPASEKLQASNDTTDSAVSIPVYPL